jgi:hypothetical protein
MNLFKFILLLFHMLPSTAGRQPVDGFCGVRNSTTQDGEEVNYAVFYSLAGIYVHAGDASFTNHLEKLNGKNVFHVTGSGQTRESYDWLYRVRDKYESYIDTSSFLPLKFSRKAEEGKERKDETIFFNRTTNTATSKQKDYEVPNCVQDVLSAVYYARNLDYSKYRKGDKIPFDMFLDNEVHHLYVRYMGKEDVKTRFGKFKAIRIKPLLVKGTIFSGGENMNVWVSDDDNHIPLRVESQIMIGSIKVDMVSLRNPRHPFTAFKKSK